MQPELFPDPEGLARHKAAHPPLFPHRFLRVRVAYEDLVFAAMGSLLFLLAGFCLGVERGKLLVATRSGSAPAAPAAEATLPIRELKGAAPLQKEKLPFAGGYAIQLASFLDRTPAEREAKRLLRQGFTPQVIPQGRFFELRVVGFRSREEALGPSASLKKMYHDSFIKRVSSGQ